MSEDEVRLFPPHLSPPPLTCYLGILGSDTLQDVFTQPHQECLIPWFTAMKYRVTITPPSITERHYHQKVENN